MDIVLGIVAPVLQLALAAGMLCRRLVAEFRYFFAYTLYSVLVIVVRLWARHTSAVSFFLWYSMTEVIYGLLALFAIQEAFQAAVASLSIRFPRSRAVPLIFLIGSIAFSLWSSVYRPYQGFHSFNARVASGTYSFTSAVRCAEIIVLISYLLLKRRFDFRRQNAGIITGFGIYASTMLASYLLHDQFGARFEPLYRYLAPGAYVGAAFVWLVVFVVPEPHSTRLPPDQQKVEKMRKVLDQQLEVLQRLRGRRQR
jgi:hypothetical protein